MAQTSTHTILIVDDIGSNRMLLRKMLGHVGYPCEEAANGQEAIDVFKRISPDLILMDINMPVMNGYEATAAIKELAGENHVPIIFVTALSANLSLTESLQSGGDDYINKPVDMNILESKVAAHLRIRELNQKLLIRNQEWVYEQETIEHFFNKALNQSYFDESFIRYQLSPVAAFNGDILLAEKGPDGSIYVMLGDFTGHGLRAAMGTLPTTQTFFPLAKQGAPLGEIAAKLNSELRSIMPPDMFCAAILLKLDSSGCGVTTWAGGMPAGLWAGANWELKGTIDSHNMPLGILPDKNFKSETVQLDTQIGDQLYLFSDGIVEAGTMAGEAYGEARLRELLASPSKGRFDRILDDLDNFRDGLEQEDDITLVELTCIANTHTNESGNPEPKNQLASG